jgi:ribonuclease VapC
MVVDTSALIAILLLEPEAERFTRTVAGARPRLVSAANLLEAAIVIEGPAGLNFGDCFAYALAKTTGLPLLFKGGDFAQTDITPGSE